MIIGITGTLGAGKGTIVEYLKSKGFKHYSARDFITQEIVRRGMPVNRDSMVEIGNDLRAKNGASYVLEELYKRAVVGGGDCILESIRTVGEVEALRKKNNFYLLAVDADPKLRYKRIVVRGSSTDRISFEDFVANEKRECESEDPAKQNLTKCIALADFKLENNGTVEELNKQVEEVLAKIYN
ncbi:MAG TPA: AAA family ATPase [bacterium]|nr:AAA family ATPase [bacterium]